jgi:hypothetical protein
MAVNYAAGFLLCRRTSRGRALYEVLPRMGRPVPQLIFRNG